MPSLLTESTLSHKEEGEVSTEPRQVTSHSIYARHPEKVCLR
jgi:hypothetical protein